MTGRTFRCAIYTRKSSEEGLEQDFNSLDAQLEACSAYIASQKHEGWQRLPQRYDDGGWSGGSLERPGLKQLLADVAAGRVDIIVVYKVDRLTRSLADFARIVEILDARKVSFVSVTQQFNTTTSMGRLTLNVLLSFAQFEREVTAERIRDKIAASKAKGMWMGGNVPLGYDVVDRKLVVNQAEAAQVRHIFERYLAIGAVDPLVAELYGDGHVSKRRPGKAGNLAGGCKITRGALYTILANRLYIGEIAHKGKIWPGQHEAIVDRGLWNRVLAQLEEHRRRWGDRGGTTPALFKGLLVDEKGHKLTATHTRRHGRVYRYYLSPPGSEKKMRIPAEDFERALLEVICGTLREPGGLISVGDQSGTEARIGNASKLAEKIEKEEKQDAIRGLVESVVVGEGRVILRLDADALTDGERYSSPQKAIFEREVRFSFKRRGGEGRLILGEQSSGSPDPTLVAALGGGWAMHKKIFQEGKSLTDVAREYNCTHGYIRRLVRLAGIAPDIIQEVLDGRCKSRLSLGDAQAKIEPDWRTQRTLFQRIL